MGGWRWGHRALPVREPLVPTALRGLRRPGRPPTVPWWLLSNLAHPGVPWGLAQPSSCPGPEALEAGPGLLCSPLQGNAALAPAPGHEVFVGGTRTPVPSVCDFVGTSVSGRREAEETARVLPRACTLLGPGLEGGCGHATTASGSSETAQRRSTGVSVCLSLLAGQHRLSSHHLRPASPRSPWSWLGPLQGRLKGAAPGSPGGGGGAGLFPPCIAWPRHLGGMSPVGWSEWSHQLRAGERSREPPPGALPTPTLGPRLFGEVCG